MMAGLDKLILGLTERIELLEKQMENLMIRHNAIDNKTELNRLKINENLARIESQDKN